MNDVDGKEVNVGDLVRVLVVRDDIPLAEDEKPHVQAMLNNKYEIEEFVNGDTQISVSYTVESEEESMWGGLYLSPNEFRLVEKRT